ncbi:MAG TPA: Eco57I restriction-modification methylase domain-containing protein, partial [Anaerolineae bacterium]|nr:Eco57I restriction-modification methylase domain-containing protein [Anaerolineae bacterium]
RVAVHPHVLSVDRQSRDPVVLRVLRRFSYTEADPQFQFEKLLSAYTVAEWSEPLFNNRALFSDYHLNQRLRESDEWQENPQAIYRSLRTLLLQVRQRLAGENEATTQGKLLEPIFDVLGFAWHRGNGSGDDAGNPDYRLYDPDANENDHPLALCLAYKWNRYLDGRDETRDNDRPDHNPGARVVSALESGEAPFVIVTNGKLWRLYAARAHSRATNYYEVDLEEAVNSPDREEAIRYFWLLFRESSFTLRAVVREGETRSLCFLDQLLEDSETYAKELGERLKDRVFDEIFPHLAEGFIEYIRREEGKEVELGQDRLHGIYQGTLTFLYRMMFVLYAESRDLLPVKDQRGYWGVSLSKLKGEIARDAGDIVDAAPGRLRRAYSADSTILYEQLSKLFTVIDQGDPDLNVPRYNGGLFLTAPRDDDVSPEAANARFLCAAKIPDRYMALGLDLLARDVDAKTQALVMIDFKSLGVRQLGSIYEGLLEFKLRIARERMAIVKGKRTEEIIPYREAKKMKRRILTQGRGESRRERTLPKGAVYLENTRQERRATGSYYTPDHIVKYIVEHTVGPVLEDKLASLRPRLRELERRYRTHRQNAIAKSKLGRYEDPEKFWNNAAVQELAYDVLDIKVLDPAMGSGHFLVEAVDFITDHLLHFLNGFPDNPVRASLDRTRRAILGAMEEQGVSIDPDRLNDVALLKRQVLKRCVYGVDLNPMAVELAKVSLWLDAFTLGAPLSFLDHHLRYGNSLVGAMARDADQELRGETTGQPTLWGGPFEDLLRQAEIMLGIGQLADATIEQVHESANLFRRFEEAAKPYKQLLDVFVIRHFGEERAADFLRLYGVDVISAKAGDLPKPYREVLAERERLYLKHHFCHWDLEFPEVYIDLKKGTWRDDAGFEAVVGNPPYVSAIELNKVLSEYEKPYWKTVFESARGAYDEYILFLELATRLARPLCRSGLITPNKYLSAPYGEALRTWLSSEHKLADFYDLSRANPFD